MRQDSEFNLRYWSFYPLLIFTMLWSGYTMVRIDEERKELVKAHTALSQRFLPMANEMAQLRQWIDDWVLAHYQYQNRADQETFRSQSSYYLDKITAQIGLLLSMGQDSKSINPLHDYLQRLILSSKSLAQAMAEPNSNHVLKARIVQAMQTDLDRVHLFFKQWQGSTLEDYNRANQEFNQQLAQWARAQIFLLLWVCVVSAYVLLRLSLRWWHEQKLIHQLHHQDGLDIPNLRQLRVDFDKLMTEHHAPPIALLRLKLTGIAEHTRIFGTQSGILANRAITQRVSTLIGARATPAEVYYLSEQTWAILALLSDSSKNGTVGVHQREINHLAQQLLDEMEKPVVLKNLTLRFTAKIGVSLYPYFSQNFPLLMQQAELALSTLTDTAIDKEKTMGTQPLSHVSLFQPNMVQEVNARIALAEMLRNSVHQSNIEGWNETGSEGGFRLRYQPRFFSTDQNKWSIGADIFWVRGEEIYTREHFSAVAEASGLAVDIGDWVIQQGLRQWRAWHEQWLGRGVAEHALSLPVFPRQLADRDFPLRLNQWLTNYQVKPSRINLELAGSWAGINPEERHAALTALSAVGVGVVLADFGKSDVPLSDLPHLPINGLVIHASFIAQMSALNTAAKAPTPKMNDQHNLAAAVFSTSADLGSENDATTLSAQNSLARLILSMGKDLGLSTVAVGVSTPAQSTLLTVWGCDQLQGDLYAPLMNAEEFAKWVDQHTQPF